MIFVTAELGINHNGDVEIAKKLIDIAVNAGCDAVKFQKRTIEKVYSKEVLDSPRESPWGNTTRDQKIGLEFDKKEYDIIDEYCKEKSIEWYASAWDIDSQLFLKNYDFTHNKVASAMLTDTELVNIIAQEKKYTFISTGMSTVEQIDKVVEIFKSHDCPFELMHCTSTYPMRVENSNLKTIKYLSERYKCDVGYSGHETGIAVSIAAVALGATSIERHITLDRSMYGSDQSASLELGGLNILIKHIKTVELCLGDGVKRVIDEEKSVCDKLRRVDTI